jgi:SAM-dependent methyltransferase
MDDAAPHALEAVLALLRCSRCEGKLDAAGQCVACGAAVRRDRGAIDTLLDVPSPRSLGERAMQSRWLSRVYETWWRPITFGVATGFRMPSPCAEGALVLEQLEGIRGPWLDLSCGPGNLTRALVAAAGERIVVALDRSRAMLDRVGVNAPPAVRVRGDAMELPFSSGSFGAVVNLAALDLYPDAGRAVTEAARVLARGGRLVLSTFVSEERGSRHGLWARASGVRTPTERAVAAHLSRAGLVRYASWTFGRYLMVGADKP